MRRKADLPTKPCAACPRPFAWRRKSARDRSGVKFRSDSCRRLARAGGLDAPSAASPGKERP